MTDPDALLLARLVWLRAPGVGPATLARIERAATLTEALAWPESAWRQAGLDDAAIRWLRQPNVHRIEADMAWVRHAGHRLLWPGEPDYPVLLAEALEAPPPLFADGDPTLLHRPCIAVVGARRATPGGLENARWFARTLAAAGYTIVSGLALGVDTAAHRAALDTGGATVAVLGTGVDVPYPLGNVELAHGIRQSGAVLSEFPPGTTARPESFPRRNRVISGLCRATLVVEAGLRSGSLITARLAAEQNREVFAIPGSIHNENARGCHRLIRDGAILVEDPGEILAELGDMLARFDALRSATPSQVLRTTLPEDARRIADAMGFDPVDFDTLQHRTGLTPQAISTMLTALVLEDRVADLGGGRFAWRTHRETAG